MIFILMLVNIRNRTTSARYGTSAIFGGTKSINIHDEVNLVKNWKYPNILDAIGLVHHGGQRSLRYRHERIDFQESSDPHEHYRTKESVERCFSIKNIEANRGPHCCGRAMDQRECDRWWVGRKYHRKISICFWR